MKTNFELYRQDFPILSESNRGKPIIYFDNASSAQKPKKVIDAMNNFYQKDYANIHRGIYELSERASALYETARQTVQVFIHAEKTDEIIFTKSSTEAINLVAHSFARAHFSSGDEIILSEMEHHSNIVPWYLLAKEIGCIIKVIPVLDSGELDLQAYQSLLSHKTKLVAITHVSNVMGTINPVESMIKMAHDYRVPVLLDGAQAAPHMSVDVSTLDCDFYVFSAHKLYGPTGIGVLYGKSCYLEQMVPYQGGGGMIESVSFSNVTFARSPQCFEAGTPHIAGVIGLDAAIKYLNSIGLAAVQAHEQALLKKANQALTAIPGLRIIGESRSKLGVISFVMDGIHPHDLGTVLDHKGIAVRAGHHCAMPLMTRFQIPATVRVSFGLYNQEEEIDPLIDAIHSAKRLLS